MEINPIFINFLNWKSAKPWENLQFSVYVSIAFIPFGRVEGGKGGNGGGIV